MLKNQYEIVIVFILTLHILSQLCPLNTLAAIDEYSPCTQVVCALALNIKDFLFFGLK